MIDAAERARLVAAAEDSIVRGSRSFAAASRLFDATTRERVWLLYAWCRAADDIADGQEMGHGRTAIADPAAALATIRDRTDRVLAGGRVEIDAFDALGLVAAECGIPASLPRDVVAGFALDAEGFEPADENDLLRYCYHVAGAVGVMMAIVMGVDAGDAATLDRACDLGLAFQLSNIARDVVEDAEAGRCYLPADWLRDAGIARRSIADPACRPAVAALAARLAAMAAAYEASARMGAAALPPRSAWAVLAAAGIYGDIARKVARAGSHAWDERVHTRGREKLAWVLRAGLQTILRADVMPRDPALWRRPSAVAA
ncbi:MAG: phytoene/squalene synthase family protein [Sphingomonas fennica]